MVKIPRMAVGRVRTCGYVSHVFHMTRRLGRRGKGKRRGIKGQIKEEGDTEDTIQ